MLESLPKWDHDTLHREIFALIEKRGVKNGLTSGRCASRYPASSSRPAAASSWPTPRSGRVAAPHPEGIELLEKKILAETPDMEQGNA